MIDETPEAFISGTLVNEVKQETMPGGGLVINTTIECKISGKTHRYPIKAWGKMATALAKKSIGDRVSLVCGITQERWLSKRTRERHSRICFIAEDFDKG